MPGMSERSRERRGPLFWLMSRSRRFWIIAVISSILYVASFGPACWITSRVDVGARAVEIVYQPIMQVGFRGPSFVREIVLGYGELVADPRYCFAKSGPIERWTPVEWWDGISPPPYK